MTHPPTVFVIDDDEAVRDSFRCLLESVKHRVETFDSAEAFLADYNMHQTGCLLLDVRMPKMSGLQLQQILNKRKFAIPIIIVTGHGDVPMAVKAMKNGALDFVEKPFHNQDMLDKIQAAMKLDKRRKEQRLEHDAVIARLATLSPREHDVLQLVVAENTNKQIAAKLKVSIKTVESHRSRLMDKIHARSLVNLLDILWRNEIENPTKKMP